MLLKLTDGTTSINFDYHSGTNPYYLTAKDGWTPQIAGRAIDALTPTIYSPVIEKIAVRIFGTTGADALSRLHDLTLLLDAADRFGAGDLTVTPVLLQYMPNGSTQQYETIVYGRPEADDQSGVTLRPEFNSELNGFTIALTIRLLRAGEWYPAADAAVSSSSVNPGAIFSIALTPDHPTPSPIDLRWNLPTLSASRGYFMGTQMLAICASASDITVLEAEDGTLVGSIVSTAVANARGGDVARWTPTPSQQDYIDFVAPANPSAVGRYAIYVSVSTNSPTAGQFSIQANISMRGGGGIQTPRIVVPTLNSKGQCADALFLGVMTIPVANSLYYFQLQLDSTVISGAYTLDIDYIVLVRLAPTTTILTIDNTANQGFAQWRFTDFGAAATQRQHIKHRSTEDLYPIALIEKQDASVQGILDAINGPLRIHVNGTNASGIWMAANHANASTAEFNGGYRVADSANAVHSTAFTATRRRAYLVPE